MLGLLQVPGAFTRSNSCSWRHPEGARRLGQGHRQTVLRVEEEVDGRAGVCGGEGSNRHQNR